MAVETPSDRTPSIAPGTAIGGVHLTVSSLERSRAFYERMLGLVGREQDDGSLSFGASRWTPLLQLVGDPSAPPRDPRQTGLFHFAVLVPTRRDLAVALVRLARGGWRLDGASDHLVSEALYLSDPDGNGIEIYRDRDRSEWPRDAAGHAQMGTLPLDLEDVVGELDAAEFDPEADALLPAGTRIGHVHLQVSELAQTEAFYAGLLGFEVTVRGYPGALFVSAGGYHHHVGLNTWNSRGGSRPPGGGVGLRAYEVRLGDAQALAETLDRVRAAGVAVGPGAGDGVAVGSGGGGVAVQPGAGDGALVRDPSGNGLLLTV